MKTWTITDNDRPIHLTQRAENHFRIHRFGSIKGTMGTTDLIGIGRRIIIMGDVSPGLNGVISDPGYRLGWLAGARDEYLCSKFLERKWTRARAVLDLEELADQATKESASPGVNDYTRDSLLLWAERLNHMAVLVDDGEANVLAIRSLFDERGVAPETSPGWGYCPREVRILSEIQRLFALLAAEMVKP